MNGQDTESVKSDGFLILRGAVEPERVERARRAINAHLGEHGMRPEDLPGFRTRTYCPDLRDTPPIGDLIRSPAVTEAIDSLIGLETIDLPAGGQIALRFPQPPDEAKDAERRAAWERGQGYHIDGAPSPPDRTPNGVPPGEVHNFAMLVGVLLNDQPTPYRGNFSVWPGSHLEAAAWFREHGTDDVTGGGNYPRVATAAPLQVTGKAGDAVLAHHLLAHGIAPNLSGDVRYNCFFRLWPTARGRYNPAALTNPWAEWKVDD